MYITLNPGYVTSITLCIVTQKTGALDRVADPLPPNSGEGVADRPGLGVKPERLHELEMPGENFGVLAVSQYNEGVVKRIWRFV